MDADYWIARWAEGRIGFHRPTVQAWLVEHAGRFLSAGDERVLVPFCGKSVDLVWLEQRGHSVVGVDLAEQALCAFFAEQQRPFSVQATPPGSPIRVLASGRIELWHGDLFAVDPALHGKFPALFDRAALIALPLERRADYAAKLLTLLAPGGRMLLIGLEYDQTRMAGPPFSVACSEVVRHFGTAGRLELLGQKSVLDEEPHFRAKGLSALTEYAFLLETPALR